MSETEMNRVFAKTKGLTDRTTHYCPGCTHGIIHRLIGEVLEEFDIIEKTIGIAPVGCAGFCENYFSCDMVGAAHGRAIAVATGAKRARPDRVVFTYQGDGDGAAIGLAETISAAARGEKLTSIFVNNAIYGMTGGQMAPTTLVGQTTSTSPYGRDAGQAGFPLDLPKLLSQVDGAVYVASVSVDTPQEILKAKKAIKKAFQFQLEGLGFSFVSILSTCPTNWGVTPVEALTWLQTRMKPYFVMGELKVPNIDMNTEKVSEQLGNNENENGSEKESVKELMKETASDSLDSLNHLSTTGSSNPIYPSSLTTSRIVLAGFGGQGVLFMGKLLAQAGMIADKHVSWIPSYGPEMRGGTANCSVVVSNKKIGSPTVGKPDIAVVMNTASYEKFVQTVVSGGTLYVNASIVPEVLGGSVRDDIRVVRVPVNEIAHRLGKDQVGNIVMLGVLQALTPVVSEEAFLQAMHESAGKKPEMAELNSKALEAGREFARKFAQ